MPIKKLKINGYSLIELMISISIMLFLIMLSAPNYAAWMANLRVKNTAESINLGLLQARSEAIRRNELIVFSINPDTSWSIKTKSNIEVNKKSNEESSKGVELEILPAGADKITFNGFGTVTLNEDGTDAVNDIRLSNSNGFAGVKNLRLRISRGGSSFICDPAVATSYSDYYCKDI